MSSECSSENNLELKSELNSELNSEQGKEVSFELKNLNAATIELTGKHLIEASAGTGKTYNITRIYLRLLLERELTVEQILLMTFTKDATQELRGRIDAFIHQALNEWDTLKQTDDYFAALDKLIEKPQREFLLKRALLFLDEASIFTIHGFCQRVLNQYAFTSGLPFNANMAANSSEVTLQVCQDWFRHLAKTDVTKFKLLASFWATPESFLSSFAKAISHTSPLSVVDEEQIASEFISLARKALDSLQTHTDLLETALIKVKSGAAQETRRLELQQLITWLESVIDAKINLKELAGEGYPIPVSFIDGRRFGKSEHKTLLNEVFAPVKAVKDQASKIANKIDKAKAYAIVKNGIYTIRAQVIEQKQRLNLLDFDDLINTLADCLKGAGESNETATLLAGQLLNQYPVALIDEFQDTDPKQFGILQAVYYGESAKKANAGLFLIGDPKQAIYGFRGGDIFAYLSARSGCDYHWLMDTNWRSTPDMIAGYNQLFSTPKSGEADKGTLTESTSLDSTPIESTPVESVFGFGIPYLPVLAGKKQQSDHSNLRKLTADNEKALQFIHFSDPAQLDEKVGQASRPLLAQWCANEILTLLNDSAEKNSPSSSSSTSPSSSVIKPKDIAILVRDGAEARDIKHALEAVGLDSVFLSDRANLFHSKQAKQLLSLLKAVLLPENERVFIAGISCGLLGYTPAKLQQLQQNEMAYQTLKFSFVDYRTQWQRQGFITMAIQLMHNLIDVPDKNKDRCLTNILHLFEILQAASVRLCQGSELLYWFEQQCNSETSDVEVELRLESDGDLIRLITQHGSKGLEYPYVFIPFATRHKDPLKFGTKTVNYLEYHNEKGELCLSLDGSKEARKAMSNEAYAESIRLLYVAVTRAERRCYVFSCAFENYHLSPLGKTLQLKDKESITDALNQLKAGAEEAIGIREVCFESLDDSVTTKTTTLEVQPDVFTAVQGKVNTQLSTDTVGEASDANTAVKVSKFTGNIERDWWLSSFSALSRNIRHAGISNPDRDSDAEMLSSDEMLSAENICFKLAKGAHTGNLLHDILEHTDFSVPNWDESIENPLQRYGELISSSSVNLTVNGADDDHFNTEDLIQWLEEIIHAPFISSTNTNIGTSTDTSTDASNKTAEGTEEPINLPCASLSMLPISKTLRESEFYFPMQGQGTGALVKILSQHRINAPRKGFDNADMSKNELKYPVMLPTYKKLSGMMHGFIDLVFEYQGRYYVSDYKSNHLGDNFKDYNFDALLDTVEKNYYDLQYLIYSLALHRYLQQNLPNYNVSEHFGGIYYLFLRGMTTKPEYKNSGVYYRKITEEEINQLDSLFSFNKTQENKDSKGEHDA